MVKLVTIKPNEIKNGGKIKTTKPLEDWCKQLDLHLVDVSNNISDFLIGGENVSNNCLIAFIYSN